MYFSLKALGLSRLITPPAAGFDWGGADASVFAMLSSLFFKGVVTTSSFFLISFEAVTGLFVFT